MDKKKVAIICVIIFVVASFSIFWTKDTTITDVEKYRQWDDSGIQGGLEIFPEFISKPDNTEYYYNLSKGLFDNGIQIYLKSTLDKEEFEKEVERLSKVTNQYEGKKQKIEYKTKGFNYPAYVSIYNFDSEYEYALVDEKNLTISYIYLQYIDDKEIMFDKTEMPNDYREGKDSFNIYAYQLEDESGWYINNKNNVK